MITVWMDDILESVAEAYEEYDQYEGYDAE